MTRLLTLIGILTLALAVACSGSDEDSNSNGGSSGFNQSGMTRTAETGGISVDATWLTEDIAKETGKDLSAYPVTRFVLIEVEFTTHSGDLNKVKMEEAASLKQSATRLKPAAWISISDDSHHRSGVLAFSKELSEGPVEVTIDLGEGSLAFRWEAPPG